MPRKTPTHRLLDRLIDGGLEAFVREHRADGRSWRVVSREIYDATGEDISIESLRSWFPDDENGEAA